jgi:hypothetical protein
MKKIIYFSIRFISVVLLLPSFICAIPGFALMLLADEINPEESSIKEEIKNQ